MICDYYIVRKGYLQIRDLYNAENDGPYYATYGIQWRGWAAYLCGIMINVVGFAGAVGTPVPIGANYIYRLNFFTGFIVSAVVYYVLCKFFPVPALSPTGKWCEVGDQIKNPSMVYGMDMEEGESSEERGESTAERLSEKTWWERP